jgi:hypothetical protein
LESVIKLPVFSANGVLCTARGYVEELQAYLDPQGKFLPVDAKPSDDDVRRALSGIEDPFRDFPFSDAFNGEEDLPYKVGDPDANGYRRTNGERGISSRWNIYAAALHPGAPPYG